MGTSVIVCTDLWGKELHKQVHMGIVVTSGSLCGVMVAQWPGMPEMWGLISAQYFPFSSHPRDIIQWWKWSPAIKRWNQIKIIKPIGNFHENGTSPPFNYYCQGIVGKIPKVRFQQSSLWWLYYLSSMVNFPILVLCSRSISGHTRTGFELINCCYMGCPLKLGTTYLVSILQCW